MKPRRRPLQGTLLVTLDPLYESGLDGVTPGSSCIANAYTSNHERMEKEEELGFFHRYLSPREWIGRRRARH